jgi:hypothetical protein
MSNMMKYFVGASASVAWAMVSSAASAAVPQPITVPEPGLFGLVAAGAAAVIVAARLRNKK